MFIFVHDLWPEIGHSRALIEKINNLEDPIKFKIKELIIVCFSSDNPQKIFPGLNCRIISFPMRTIYPFLLKCICFHFFSFFVYWLNKSEENIFISIGISSLFCDIVDVQFIHKDWEKHYFFENKMSLIRAFYKKILFSYLKFIEKLIYNKPKLKLLALSNFIKQSLDFNFRKNKPLSHLIYSSVNRDNFFVINKDKNEIIRQELNSYRELQLLNLKKPILLFIGAYERKGLDYLLSALKDKDYQLIIIGESERGKKYQLPESLYKKTIIRIDKTNLLNAFYNICDMFIFPTRYEPFGLVILEAAMCGMDILTTRNEVGASEIISEMNGIHFLSDIKSISNFEHAFQNLTIIDRNTRLNREKERKKIIDAKGVTWKNAGQNFGKLINECLDFKK